MKKENHSFVAIGCWRFSLNKYRIKPKVRVWFRRLFYFCMQLCIKDIWVIIVVIQKQCCVLKRL